MRDEESHPSRGRGNWTLAVPVLRYNFGIIHWRQEELRKLDRKTRQLLTIRGQHDPRAEVDHLYVPENRKEGAWWC